TVCELLHIDAPPPEMADWEKFVKRVINPKKHVTIGFVGKYTDLQDAYKSVYESPPPAAASHDCGIRVQKVDAEELESDPAAADRLLGDVAGVLVPGGFGE